MEMQERAEAVLDPLAIPLNRLYRMSPNVYQGMIEHGLLTDRDRVVFRDGLLVHEAAGDAENDPIESLYRMPIDVYDGIAGIGLLGPGDKVELLDGLLVTKMTKGDPHIVVTTLTQDALRGVVPAGWHLKKEDPVALPSGPKGQASQPEPDVSVIRGGVRDYLTRKPGPEDTALVVEVSDRSLREDRAKLVRYAWSRIPVAWIVNLSNETVEVHTRPTGPAKPAKYEETKIYRKGDHVPVVIDGREVGRIAVVDLLP